MLLGQPRVRLRVSADAPAASLSVKLCDVFPDGTSALITRGSLDLTFRDGVHAPAEPRPLVPGEEYDVEVVLDACAYQLDPGQRLRLSVAGADWPNTIAPPAPVTLTVHDGSLELPLRVGEEQPAAAFTPGAPTSSEEPDDISWTVTRDVLRRTTTCAVGTARSTTCPTAATPPSSTPARSSSTAVPSPSTRADCTYRLTWPGVDVRVSSTMRVDVTADGYDVTIEADAYEGDDLVSHRAWNEHVPR